MNSAVRIGVAGAGLIGRKHIELVAASPDCVLAGIADPSPEAKAFAESRGFPGTPIIAPCWSGRRLTG